MRQIVTTRNGGVEVLKVQEAPDPKPVVDIPSRIRALWG